ncbi:MAG: RDD family protein [Candidatus Bathyarchaeia archaeon]
MVNWKLTDNDHREITIETLATPPLHIQPAPLPRRFGAAIIDSFVVLLGWETLEYTFRQSPSQILSFTAAITLFSITFLYYFTMEWILSATLGKLIMKLRVVVTNGDPCALRDAFLRNFFRIIDWLPLAYLIGIILLSISDKRQRAGDRIAHTVVTMAPERDKNPPPAPFLFH